MHCSRAFVGAHLQSQYPKIEEVAFRPTGIEQWAGSDEGIRFEFDKTNGTYSTALPLGEWRQPLSCVLDEGCRVDVEYVHHPAFKFENSMPVEHHCMCRIVFSRDTSLDECYKIIKVFCDFLSFATRIMSGIEGYSIKTLDGWRGEVEKVSDSDQWVEVVGLNTALRRSSEKRMFGRGGRNYFTAHDMPNDFQMTLLSWYQGAWEYDSAYHLYFAIASRKQSTYLEHEFFTYVQCLEGFYNKASGKKRFLPKKEYRRLIDDSVFPYLKSIASEDLATAMRDSLNMANSLTLRQHLLSVVTNRSEEFIRKWVPDEDAGNWVGNVTRFRHDFAHVLDQLPEGMTVHDEYFSKTVTALRLLVEAWVLEMAGFTSDEADEILNHTYKSEQSIST